MTLREQVLKAAALTGLYNDQGVVAYSSDVLPLIEALAEVIESLCDGMYRHHMDCDKTCVDVCPIKIKHLALAKLEALLKEGV